MTPETQATALLRTGLLLACSALACGPSTRDDAAELRHELAGFYSNSGVSGQVNPPEARIDIFEFSADGSGTYYELSCIGEHSNERAFEWTVAPGGLVADIIFGDDYVNDDGAVREGRWPLPDEGCAEGTLAEFNFGGDSSLWPGRRCDPQLGPVGTEGRRLCEFELCGGESLRCGGAEGRE